MAPHALLMIGAKKRRNSLPGLLLRTVAGIAGGYRLLSFQGAIVVTPAADRHFLGMKIPGQLAFMGEFREFLDDLKVRKF